MQSFPMRYQMTQTVIAFYVPRLQVDFLVEVEHWLEAVETQWVQTQ
jgi:hypothetical protein